MPSSVFITRSLAPDSPFLQRLSANGYTVQGASLITFESVPFTDVPASDWVFFYSARAVHYFFEQLRQLPAFAEWEVGSPLPVHPMKERPPHSPKGQARRIGCIGPTTAQHLRRYISQVDFVGTGDPATTATAFEAQAKGQRVLFPSATTSQRAMQRRLADAITAIDLHVYHNVPRSNVAPRSERVLVFTSPMNVRAYAAVAAWQPEQQVVAIGRSTATALRNAQCTAFVVADAPNEVALANAVLSR